MKEHIHIIHFYKVLEQAKLSYVAKNKIGIPLSLERYGILLIRPMRKISDDGKALCLDKNKDRIYELGTTLPSYSLFLAKHRDIFGYHNWSRGYVV